MKKLFTAEDFAIALIVALGYGFGFEIPKLMGCPIWLSALICLAAGILPEWIMHKFVFSSAVQKKSSRRFFVLGAALFVFFAAQYLAMEIMDMDLSEYIAEEIVYVIIPPVIVFVFRMALRIYRSKKIRGRYGDGSSGFLFDDLLKREDIDEFNQINQKITGEYDSDCAVKTKNGIFVGEKIKDSLFFRGIPYAKPPIGKLRWKAPESPEDSDEVFQAKYFGASAIQPDYEGSLLKHHRQSEDCLTLNICVSFKNKRKNEKSKNPVIVVFHHGDFHYGSSADPLLHADNFIKIYPDTVYVTFNYRLGILGFIDFSKIPGGEAFPDSLNLGLLDQIAALEWIQENISAFGGDPERVTVIGFESGSLSISLLAVSEKAKSLFKRAFMFHGNPNAAYGANEMTALKNSAEELLQETSSKTMDALMNLSEQQLKEAAQKLADNLSAPVRDGKLIPEDVYAAYRNGAASGIEFIIGVPSGENQIYKSSVGTEKYENFLSAMIRDIFAYLDAVLPEAADGLRKYIGEQTALTSESEAKTKAVEQFYALMTYDFARLLSESGNKVHLLYWDAKPLIKNLGSGTVDLLASFLGTREAAQVYGSVINPDISEMLQTLFRKFKDGEALRLYNNEIKGMKALNWEKFPNALVVSEKSFEFGKITDRLTDVKSMLKLLEK